MAKAYKEYSKVTVTFNDGEVKDYVITASPTIARYLSQDSGMTGTLTLLNGPKAYGIPIASIRDWCIEALPGEEIEIADAHSSGETAVAYAGPDGIEPRPKRRKRGSVRIDAPLTRRQAAKERRRLAEERQRGHANQEE